MNFLRFCTTMLLMSIAALLLPVCGALDLTTTKALSSASTLSTVVVSTQGTSAAVAPAGHLPDSLPLDTNDAVDLSEQDIWERAFDASLLLQYQLRCDTSEAEKTPRPKGTEVFAPANMLAACRQWWTCNSLNGDKVVKGKEPLLKNRGWQRGQWNFCKDKCKCEVVDRPTKHYAANFGCVKPQGGWVSGGVGGSVSRGESAPIDIGDGLKVQAYHGPDRKE